MQTQPKYNRSDIWLAELPSGIDSEMTGIRPVLIVQNQIGNKYSNLVIVHPISTKVKNMPTHVQLSELDGIERKSYVMTEHFMTLSKRRLKNRLSKAHPDTMRKVEDRILFSCGIELKHPSSYRKE